MKNKYEIRGDITAIFINCRKELRETIISTTAFPKANTFKGTWFGRYCKNTGTFYAVGKYKQKIIRLHRYLLDASPDKIVDHVDRDTLNNRDKNIREVTIAENNQNTRKEKKSVSGHRGVTFNKNSKMWCVRIGGGKNRLWLGSFNNLEEAINASINARAKLMPFSQDAREMPNVTEDLYEKRKKARNSNKTSGIRNICWLKDRKKWHVSLYVNGKQKNLGDYEDLEEAKEILEKSKKQYNIIDIAI